MLVFLAPFHDDFCGGSLLIHLTIYLSIHLFIYLSIYVFTYISIYLSVRVHHHDAAQRDAIYLSFYPYIYPFIHLSIYLSIVKSTYPSNHQVHHPNAAPRDAGGRQADGCRVSRPTGWSRKGNKKKGKTKVRKR